MYIVNIMLCIALGQAQPLGLNKQENVHNLKTTQRLLKRTHSADPVQ